jgi:uncharacterized damage-inducible protein DinB
MTSPLADFSHDFRRHKKLAEKAMAPLSEEAFFHRPGDQVNSIALIVKHLGGNLTSRWTDFLTTDGEKPGRDRDSEFQIKPEDTRAHLLAAWEKGWQTLFDSLEALTEKDLSRTVTIRGEAHTVFQALLRSATHSAYHVGQILYLVRLLQPASPWLTVAPGQSQAASRNYLKPM